MESCVSPFVRPQSCYTSYPKAFDHKCLKCGAPIYFIYATSGHRFQDFTGDIREVRALYLCTNVQCHFASTPFNFAPNPVFPYKRYSTDVWKYIAHEGRIRNQNASEIHDRLLEDFGVSLSESTINGILKEIDAYLTGKIDERTRQILLKQGIIVLAIDGQKPDDEGDALWVFTDLVSQRVLKAIVLPSAEADTLHQIVEEILKEYHVKLVGMVSDKQNNLVNLHDTYYLEIPHQYCQFHFLQNLWNHLETMDTHLHKEIGQELKQLPIVKTAKKVQKASISTKYSPYKQILNAIALDLKKIEKCHTKKFEALAGLLSFGLLQAYTQRFKTQLETSDYDPVLLSLLLSTKDELDRIIKTYNVGFVNGQELFLHFNEIRDQLASDRPCSEQEDALNRIFADIWEKVKGINNKTRIEDLRSFLPQKDTPKEVIFQEWVRLHYSYKRGLFQYAKLPIRAKTSTILEQGFSQEKHALRKRSGQAHVGAQIRTRGEYELRQVYVGKDEIKEHLGNLTYDRTALKVELKALEERISQESSRWGGPRAEYTGLQMLSQIGQEKKEKAEEMPSKPRRR
jgi:hypothetical protein